MDTPGYDTRLWPADKCWTDHSVKERSWNTPRLIIELAASGRSTCKLCRETITQNAIRVDLYHGQGMDHGPESFGFAHLACFKSEQSKARGRVWKYNGCGFGVVTQPELHFEKFDQLIPEAKARVLKMYAAPATPRDSAATMSVGDRLAASKSGKGAEYYAALPRPALLALLKAKSLSLKGTNEELRARLVEAENTPAPESASSTTVGEKRKAEDESEESTQSEDAAAAHPNKKAKTGDAAAAAAASSSTTSGDAMADVTAAPVDLDLSGSRWLLMGGFSCGKSAMESQIRGVGAEIASTLSKKVQYVLVGTPSVTEYGQVSGPGSKKHKEAKKMKLNLIDEEEAKRLLDQHRQTKLRLATQIKDGLIPDLVNIVSEFC